MLKISKSAYRAHSSFIRTPLSKRQNVFLQVNNDIVREFWILIERYSEIEDAGKDFIRSKGVRHKTKINIMFKSFQALVRQAKSFYLSAQQMQTRSASLLYYYSFLNLVKAGIILNKPDLVNKKLGHGLYYTVQKHRKFNNETLGVTYKDNSVFPIFYNDYFNKVLDTKYFNINSLLGYCTDIGYQYLQAGYGYGRILPSFHTMLFQNDNKSYWSLIGINDFKDLLKYKKSLKIFSENFDQVEVSDLKLFKYNIREIFNIDAKTASAFTFFQSKNVFPVPANNIVPDVEFRKKNLESLKNIMQSYYFGRQYDFSIALPYSLTKEEPLDETAAIYLIMYYLSCLVRYKPYYLEELLNRQEAWLIDSFIQSCPSTFLKGIISWIVDIDYVLTLR